MKPILYLHGFSSSAASHKAHWLKQALAPHPFTILDYPSHQPRAATAIIRRTLDHLRQQYPDELIALIGSSLGGYYAQYFAAHDDAVSHVVLINPALDPQPPLAPWIGRNINMVSDEPFEFTLEDWQELADFDVTAEQTTPPTLLLVDEADDVIPAQYALEKYHGRPGKQIAYPGGSHAFDHLPEAVAEIREFLA